MKKIFSPFLYSIILLTGIILPQAGIAQSGNPVDDVTIITPDPNINIPGISFTEAAEIKRRAAERHARDGRIILQIPFLGEYIRGIYRYALGISGIIAVIVIILGGFQWAASGGSPETISGAKKRITNGITGLIILLGSYSILYAINPNLVRFYALEVPYILTKNLEYQEGGDSNRPIVSRVTNENFLREQGLATTLFCPKTGGIEAVPQIIKSLEGHVAYRFGGKGGPPPYSETNSAYTKYNNYCPEGNICFDCSGMLAYVYDCAGLPALPGGTANIFGSQSERIEPNLSDGTPSINYETNTVNGRALQPGDLLGWKAGDAGKTIGHVIMYIGDGKTIEAAGGDGGRQPNANPKIKNFADFAKIRRNPYPFTWIRRAPQSP